MFSKECRICGNGFMAKTEKRQLCDRCQKNSAKYQEYADKDLIRSKARAGELPSQQYYTSVCKHCGKEWITYGGQKNFCNTECLQQYMAEKATCRVCKTPLYPLGIVAKNGQGCCSDNCTEIHRKNVAREDGRLGTCIVCKKEFIKKNEYAPDLCSTECKNKDKWNSARARGMISSCIVCKKEFIKKYMQETTCSTACYNESRRQMKPVTVSCVICSKTFEKHTNAKQDVCSKECRVILNKKKLEATRIEQRKKEKAEAKEKRTRADNAREQSIRGVLSGQIKGNEARKLHLCTDCKTSQAECIMFSSRFTYHPKECVIRAVDGHNVVLVCPKYNS